MKRLAKIGKEIEGEFLGLQTVFCEAHELPRVLELFSVIREKYSIEHLYIGSAGTLTQADYDKLATLNLPVTAELTEMPWVQRPPNLRFMLRVELSPSKLGFFSDRLTDVDQVKFTSNQYVATALTSSFVLTDPVDFLGDFEITENDL